jgi:hypothetical protein
MRVLLDACVPKGVRRSLSGHEVQTAHEMGWGDLDNGDLLDANSNRLKDLLPLVSGLLAALSTLKPGTVKEITG